MKKSQTEPTTARNLQEKFDRGEDVLDYFDVSKARVIRLAADSRAKPKPGYVARRNSGRRAVVREKTARYRGKK